MTPGLSDQLSAMLDASSGQAAQNNMFGLSLATVKNINDDKKLKRV